MSAGEAPSIFTRIILGEVPSHRVFENAHVFAFLDINPLALGHTLVVPKREVERLEALPEEEAAAIGAALGRIARAVLETVGAQDYNVLQNNGPTAGQVVRHVHFHIIPRRAGDGLGYRWNTKQADAGELAELAAKIAARLAEGA
ncbi:MAG: HIT family protein [Phycisphaerae bacterium]|nr:HIT family protein [Phycisphaerae bacterium]MCZ2401357.1 HIT family protein [Phycisphaerae bacterium]NUQ49223.1 HIT family protein [Phycisphaerae bacterium]